MPEDWAKPNTELAFGRYHTEEPPISCLRRESMGHRTKTLLSRVPLQTRCSL